METLYTAKATATCEHNGHAIFKRQFLIVIILALSSSTSISQENASLPKRLTPKEINAIGNSGAGTGTSGVVGIQTRVLKGDPTRTGLYTIQLTAPPNTKIEAHRHPDDRVATVISGRWYIGFGSSYKEKNLKALSPGSFYTEPPNVSHFARTGNKPVVVQITGYGPTATKY